MSKVYHRKYHAHQPATKHWICAKFEKQIHVLEPHVMLKDKMTLEYHRFFNRSLRYLLYDINRYLKKRFQTIYMKLNAICLLVQYVFQRYFVHVPIPLLHPGNRRDSTNK